MMQLNNNYAQDQLRKLYLPLAISAFWYFRRIAARRLHDSNILESSNIAVKDAGSIAFRHLHCHLTTLDLNTLSNLHIPFIFLELIGNKREFIFPKKTPKKISLKVRYRFVTHILAPLHEFLKKSKKNDKRKTQWNAECINAFNKCKNQLANVTLLAHPSQDADLALMTDASVFGLGTSLNEITSDGLSNCIW
ncbi:hypothetical protein TNCV_3268661 [Trichonephila clavipes]|nr:hypothetical protein TNCV_3268661 [Trichonephila clavipes]